MTKKDPAKELLQKYKMDKPLPDGNRKNIRVLKKRTMIHILKNQKRYSTFVFLAVSIFFWIKRFGVSFSLVKSAVVVLFALTLFVGAVAASAFITVKYLVMNTSVKEEIYKRKNKKEEVHNNELEKKINIPQYRISMAYFEYDSAISAIGRQVNSSLRNELLNLKGGNVIDFTSGPANIKSNRIIVGSITKLDTTYLITAKIIDRTTSRIIEYVTETVETESDIPRACSVVSAKIAKKI